MHARFIVALLFTAAAAACGDDRSRTEQIREDALQRRESRPMRDDVPPQDLRDADVALAEDIESLAEEAGEPPTAAEQAAVAAREEADRARSVATECAQLAQQAEALQDPEPAGSEPVDVHAVQAAIAETQSRLDGLCR